MYLALSGYRRVILLCLAIVITAYAQEAYATVATPRHTLVFTRATEESTVFIPLALREIAPLRIDSAASSSHTDADGNVWLADTGFIGGTAGNFGNIAVSNTNDPLIYQTERYQLTGYSVPVANGAYTVTLLFAENYHAAAGQRSFNVNVEGQALNNLDVFAAAGGAHIALKKTFNITVTDGTLNITFTPITGDAMIDGLEVIAH